MVSFCLSLTNNVFSYSLNDFQERELAVVLDEFGEKYDVFFSYDKSMVKDIRVAFEFKEDEKVYAALDRLLSSFNLVYDTFGEKYIVIYRKSEADGKDLTKLKHHFKEIEKIESKGRIRIFKRKKAKAISLPKMLTDLSTICLLYTSPSPRDQRGSRMPSSA